jgi:acyl carrier protein
MNVEKKFKDIVADIFRVDIKKIKGSTRYVDDLNAKSMDISALIAATESEFGIRTNAAETRANKTVQQSINYIKKLLKKKKK